MQIRRIVSRISWIPLLFISIYTDAQRSFADLSTDYWYDIYGDLNVKHQLIFFEDSVEITLLSIFNGPDQIDQFEISYEIKNGYEAESIEYADSLSIRDDAERCEERKCFYKLKLPKLKDGNLMIFKFSRENPKRTYYYDINLNEELNFGNSGLFFTEADGETPLMKAFIGQDEGIQINSTASKDTQAIVYYYDHDFEAALPPMIIDNKQVKRELIVDSIFSVPTGEIMSLAQPGLYFFQTDTTSLKGISLRVEDKYYPTLRTMDKIIQPLIYISTSEETGALQSGANKKAVFEKYWLKLASTPDIASKTMNKFYSQVEAANFFFTNYKEGWKTDMGMIYIVYGKPDEIYNNSETIDWVYNRDFSLPIIRFTFIKVKNVFSNHHYSLMRKKNFDRHWFMSVKMWREGRK